MLNINWVQNAWAMDKKTGAMKCWKWHGTRTVDRRSFVVIFIAHQGYVCATFNGKRLGVGKTLAEGQAFARSYMTGGVKVSGSTTGAPHQTSEAAI